MSNGIQISNPEPAAVEVSQLKTQLEQAKAERDRLMKFIGQVAGMQMWSCDKPDGTPHQECEEPSDGFLDSHTALMDLIETSRALLKPC